MWTTLLSLAFGALPTITKQIADARIAMAQSKTKQEEIAAQERIKALEAQRDVLIAESRTPWNALARFLLMAPFVVVLWVYIVWDKVACPWWHAAEGTEAIGDICSTDDLSANLWWILFAIIGFYFVTDVTRLLKR